MTTSSFEQQWHLKDYMNAFYRRAGIAVLIFLVMVTASLAVNYLMKPVYKASVTILVDMESPNVLTTSGMVALESQQYYSYKEYYQSQLELITSNSIIKKVYEEFDLGDTHKYLNEREPLKKFLKTIKAEPVRDTRLIKLSVENEDPVLAKKIANRIAEIFVKRNLYYISKGEITNLLKNEYLKLDTKLSEYAKVYKDKHPKMIRLRKEMADMENKITRLKQSSIESDVFDDIKLSQLDDYALQGFKANNISIQDMADVPTVPVKPKKLLNLAIGLIVGLFGGIGMAFIIEYMDDTIKDSEYLENMTKVPFLGAIPDINAASRWMRRSDKDLIVHLRPKDPVSESYRLIRTNLLFMKGNDGKGLKNIVVTSPGPQEGKTTTLCNLAISMAQNGNKVLIVDADMRRPRVHAVFRVKNENGLSEYLSGQIDMETAIKNTKIENLFLVNGGHVPPNPSELLHGDKMKEFLEKAHRAYDIVIFDSPPLVVVTDAKVLSEVTDGIIIVLRSGKTSKRVFPKIVQSLDNAKGKIIGTVLNKVLVNRANPYYHYYSRYYGR